MFLSGIMKVPASTTAAYPPLARLMGKKNIFIRTLV